VVKIDLQKLNKKTIYLFFKIVREVLSRNSYAGNRLKGKYSNLLKYKMGNFRIINTIKSSELKILMVRERHRGNVYDDILF